MLRMIFDIANFYKNSKNYEKAIEYYTEIISSLMIIQKLNLIYFIEEVEVMND